MSSRILRKQRCDAGILQVTQRDMLALTWIAEQYCIPFNQLRMLLAQYITAPTKKQSILSTSATRNAVERWLQPGFIEQPRKILHEHSPFIWLSRKGIREFELPYAYYQPKPSTLQHIYAVNTLRLTSTNLWDIIDLVLFVYTKLGVIDMKGVSML